MGQSGDDAAGELEAIEIPEAVRVALEEHPSGHERGAPHAAGGPPHDPRDARLEQGQTLHVPAVGLVHLDQQQLAPRADGSHVVRAHALRETCLAAAIGRDGVDLPVAVPLGDEVEAAGRRERRRDHRRRDRGAGYRGRGGLFRSRVAAEAERQGEPEREHRPAFAQGTSRTRTASAMITPLESVQRDTRISFHPAGRVYVPMVAHFEPFLR